MRLCLAMCMLFQFDLAAATNPPPSPPPPTTFTTKNDLQVAAAAFNANQISAIATYGPIAYWDVSSITDMSELFQGMSYFNADISGWNTSSVTDMSGMFYVRSAPAPFPLPMQALACTRFAPLRRPTPSCPPARMPPAPYARLMTRQSASAFNQLLSFDTSSVTDMSYMFTVRSAQAPPPLPIQALACTRLAPLRRPTPSRHPARMPPAPYMPAS